jgi:AbiV family abortive infection protein
MCLSKKGVSDMNDMIFCEKATQACLSNSKRYVKDADLLYSFNSYAHCLALTLVSDIELGKTAISHLLSTKIIKEDLLPPPYLSYFKQREYASLINESWWVGFVVASNVEELVQALIDVTEKVEVGKQIIPEIISKMSKENDNFDEFEKLWIESFFADLDTKGESVNSAIVNKDAIRARLQQAKKRIKTSEPFLSFPFNGVSERTAGYMIKEAFESVLPFRRRICRFTIPLKC